MATQPNIARIYVQLDALLDTRLATLARMNLERVEELMRSGYLTRMYDIFPGYDLAEFKELYSKRDEETLLNADETKMLPFLRQMVDLLDDQTIVRPYHTGVEVVVNYYPYDLSEENKVILHDTVHFWTKGLASLNLVRISDEDLTPAHCKDQYSAMIMYHFADWLRMHIAEMEKTRLIEVTLFAPTVMQHADEKTHADDLEQFERTVAHPLEALDLLTKMLIGLKLVNVDMFSIADVSGHISPSSPPPDLSGEDEDGEHE